MEEKDSQDGDPSEKANVPDGSMAVFCPACPQPGINLPENWKEKYTLYAHIVVQICTIANLSKE